MMIEGKVNLLNCNTELLCEIKEAVEVAYSQRMVKLRKVSRKGNTEFLTDFEKKLIETDEIKDTLDISKYNTASYV